MPGKESTGKNPKFYASYPHKETAQSGFKGLRRSYTSNTALCLPGNSRGCFCFSGILREVRGAGAEKFSAGEGRLCAGVYICAGGKAVSAVNIPLKQSAANTKKPHMTSVKMQLRFCMCPAGLRLGRVELYRQRRFFVRRSVFMDYTL